MAKRMSVLVEQSTRRSNWIEIATMTSCIQPRRGQRSSSLCGKQRKKAVEDDGDENILLHQDDQYDIIYTTRMSTKKDKLTQICNILGFR